MTTIYAGLNTRPNLQTIPKAYFIFLYDLFFSHYFFGWLGGVVVRLQVPLFWSCLILPLVLYSSSPWFVWVKRHNILGGSFDTVGVDTATTTLMGILFLLGGIVEECGSSIPLDYEGMQQWKAWLDPFLVAHEVSSGM